MISKYADAHVTSEISKLLHFISSYKEYISQSYPFTHLPTNMDIIYATLFGAKFSRIYTSHGVRTQVALHRLNGLTVTFFFSSVLRAGSLHMRVISGSMNSSTNHIVKNIIYNEFVKYRQFLQAIKTVQVIDLTCHYCHEPLDDAALELKCNHLLHTDCLFVYINLKKETCCPCSVKIQ